MSLSLPRLTLVTERARATLTFADLIRAAIDGGCDAILIRDRTLSRDERRQLVAAAIDLAGDRLRIIVNSDIQLAAEFGTGLHLPENGLETAAARAKLPAGTMIGRSVHSILAAIAAGDADYLLAGHVFPTETHPDIPPLGIEELARMVSVSPCPVIAIGGITTDRVEQVMDAGAYGVAVIGAICSAHSRAAAKAAARELRTAIDLSLNRKR